MGLLEDIEGRYNTGDLESDWRSALNEGGLSADDREGLLLEIRNTWRELLRILRDVDDEHERGRALVNAYIEERSRWLLINTQLQFQMFRDGRPDLRRSHRAMLVSRFAEFLEQFLDPGEIEVINRFLAKPAGGGMPAEAVTSLEEQLSDLYADREALQQGLGTGDPEAILGMVASLEDQVNDQYAASETLQTRLGISDPDDVLNFVESMDEQLRDLYADNENAIIVDGRSVTVMGASKILVRRKP
ncbi:MAG: hypothetical protein NXI24_06875 [bacterium]|nr:hypothetical protein [bacterium]